VRSSDFKVVPRRLAVESTVRSEQLRVKRVPEEEDWEVTIEPETLEPREEMGEEAEGAGLEEGGAESTSEHDDGEEGDQTNVRPHATNFQCLVLRR